MNRTSAPRTSRFLLGFLAVALLVAGGLSYFASSSPDGLDSVTLHGCQVTETADGEHLDGQCLAQNAQEHPFTAGPFADYTVRGGDATVGIAGVIGVVATLALAGALFWVLRRRGPNPPGRED
ncbi:PDGLE domain-containing protein [Pseudonocardia hispaniensis]|uniref:PDGLE domain-containing protein n=1 Tax=Pseudonocardia hispaniensis TaxID=904933 RepID=A0ABW1IZ99_9PSEU